MLSEEDIRDMDNHKKYVAVMAKNALADHRKIMNLSWGSVSRAVQGFGFSNGYVVCNRVHQFGWDYSIETQQLRHYVAVMAGCAVPQDKGLEDYL